MKNLILMLFFLLALHTSGQNTEEIKEPFSGSYYFVQSPPGEKMLQNRSDGISNIGVPLDAKVYFIYEDDVYVYYKYWPYQNNKLIKKYNEFIENTATTDTLNFKANSPFEPGSDVENHFFMEKDKFRDLTSQIYSKFKGFSVGAYSVPFRLRGIGDDFDFESALSLQANMIAGFGSYTSERSWVDLSFGLGLTGIKLNPDNSDVVEDRSANAFTTSFGIVMKPKPYANLGLFIGWDFLGKNDREINWQYNKDTWVGLGINISFNEVTTEKSPESKKINANGQSR